MINSKIIANGIVRAVLLLAALVLLFCFIYQIQTVLVYLVVAIILSLIANPIVEFFRNRLKFSNTLAVVATLIIFLSFLIGLILLFVPLITSQGNNLSLLDTDSIQQRLVSLYGQLKVYLDGHNIDIEKLIKEADLTSKLKFNFFTDFFNSVINTISSFGIGLASVFFITFFLLKDKVQFIVGAKKVLPDDHEDKILNSIYKIKELLSRYFIGLLIQLTIICILYLIVLLIFGVENAFVIAFLCAILNIIPYIGPLIGSVLAGILTMLSTINSDFQTVTLPTTIYVTIGFFIVQMIDNNVSSPIIFSKSVNSHPLEIFLVILIVGMLFGITGMIIAIPLFTILKVVGKEFFPDNKIIKVMTKNI
ncbi:AI-2E family transporter [Flavobacterium sp.]|uniref:AI-2E family transporter n=1 Tax=Flavobacterium sp. TaxID=239 RepID=UPI0026324141|nr:AI-2E family transporter [Flavobacterium sp.]